MNQFRLFSLFLFFSLTQLSFSQSTSDEVICEFPEVLPSNKGGISEMNRLIHEHLIYPEKPFKLMQEGQVKLDFVVMKDGNITGIKISSSGVSDFDNEALRLLKLLEWIPGQKNGIKVISRNSVTVGFKISEYKKSIKERGFSKPKWDKKFVVDTSLVIYNAPEFEAEYFRGVDALAEFIHVNLEYPDLAKRQGLQGVVQLSFIVEPDGRTSNIFVEKSIGGGCAEEAVLLIGQTKWKPAIQQGMVVRSRIHYSIAFSLNNDYRSNELGEQK